MHGFPKHLHSLLSTGPTVNVSNYSPLGYVMGIKVHNLGKADNWAIIKVSGHQYW